MLSSLLEKANLLIGQPIAVIAHRGAAGHVPENTMLAFEAALEMGAQAIELDVQLTADGHVVVIHDGRVDRITDGTGPVRLLTLDELRRLDAGFRFPGRDGTYPFRGRGMRIPILAEVLDAFPDTPLIIDVKTESGQRIVPALAGVIEQHGAQDRVIVGSFSSNFLRRLRELLPSVPTGFGRTEVRNLYLLNQCRLQRFYRPGAEFLLVPESARHIRLITERFLQAAESLGLSVHVWTVEEDEDMRRLVRMGVDGIMTGYPDRLVRVLEEASSDGPTDA